MLLIESEIGITIIPVMPLNRLENAFIVDSLSTPGTPSGIQLSGGYAYISDDTGVEIIGLY